MQGRDVMPYQYKEISHITCYYACPTLVSMIQPEKQEVTSNVFIIVYYNYERMIIKLS